MRAAVFLLGFFLSLPATGAVAQIQKFTVFYGVYAGGIHALDAQMRFELAPANYHVTMEAKPYGVIGSLLPWAGTYETEGRIKNENYMPDRHHSISRWREDNNQASFVYKDGALVSLKKTELEKGRMQEEEAELNPHYIKDAVDIISGAMQILGHAGPDLPCVGAPVIFDGRRRFVLQFTDKGTEELKASDYNMFSGEARVCQVEMVPKKGYSGKKRGYYKIQEEAREAGQLPRLWLGQLWPGGPYLPVRMLIKSEYGAVLLHAQKVAR